MDDLDVRDLFAMLALCGLLVNDKPYDDNAIAELSYDLADAMLEARKPREHGIASIKKGRSK